LLRPRRADTSSKMDLAPPFAAGFVAAGVAPPKDREEGLLDGLDPMTSAAIGIVVIALGVAWAIRATRLRLSAILDAGDRRCVACGAELRADSPTLESGIHTADVKGGKPPVRTAEFAAAVAANLGRVPTSCRPSVVTSHDRVVHASLPRPTSYRLRRTFEKVTSHVCGADVYIGTTLPPFELAAKLQAVCESGPFKLTMLSSRGTQVWPSGSVYTEVVDYFRARFELKDPAMVGRLGQMPTVKLLEKIAEKFDVTDFQPLKIYDGAPGFSLAQGQ